MKNIIFISFALFAFVSVDAQLVNETYTLSRDEAFQSYSYYSFKQGAADSLAGTQDSAYYTVKLNKHYPCDVQWSITLDTASTADSANIDVLWQYRTWSDDTWLTASTTAYDGDSNGEVIIDIYDTTKINVSNLPLNDKVFARQHRLFFKPTSGAGLGSSGDKVVIEKVEFKAYIRR